MGSFHFCYDLAKALPNRKDMMRRIFEPNTSVARGLGIYTVADAARIAQTTNSTHLRQVAIRYLELRASSWDDNR